MQDLPPFLLEESASVAIISAPALTLTPAEAVRVDMAADVDKTLEQAKAFVVTKENLPGAYIMLKAIRAGRDRWKALWSPHIDAAMERKRKAEADRKRVVDDFEIRDVPLDESERVLATKISGVEQALEAAQEEETKRLQAVEDKKAETERLEAALLIEEEMLTAPSREEAQQFEAELEQLLDEPVFGTVVTMEPVKPKGTGVAIPMKWSAEITSLTTLLTALVGNKLDKVLTKDLSERIGKAIMPPLNQRAVALKSALSIPGVRAKSEPSGPRIR